MRDPIETFAEWFEEARRSESIREPAAMCLSTVDADGMPSSRIVLLKGFDARGFVFYTNMESRKSEELNANPHTALCFYWDPIGTQVRIEGRAEKIGDAEADAYFATRERQSQIGAWASEQSRVLESPQALTKRAAEFTKKFAGKPIPRPPHWSGWRVVPERIEFWQRGEHRLHDRHLYRKQPDGWNVILLHP